MKKIEDNNVILSNEKKDLENIENKLNFNCEGFIFSSIFSTASIIGLTKTIIYSNNNKSYEFVSKIIENPIYMNPLLYSSLFFMGTSLLFYKNMKKSYSEFIDKSLENRIYDN
ncbi:hypothetical protein KY334_01470 [Candidatus Woesearchaeota archaeon]|nr:hypothetical protein [Candidatus Woesearchaeota archaeon]